MLDSLKIKKDSEGLNTSTKRLREMVGVLRRHDLMHGITPEKIRLIIEDLGPTFVKLGQIMSMRPDFLPSEYCDELTKLQTDVKPMTFDVVRHVIEQEYGSPWQKIFSSIDEHALGSASIAQVHRATLINGDDVVIKVQRPGIYDVMSKDIVLLKRAAALLNVVGGTKGVIDFDMVLDEMWTIAKQEMDFMMEAGHMDEFRQLNASERYIECPRVNHRLTTPRILVMEYIDGLRFDDFEGLRAKGYDADQLGRRLGKNYVKQIVEDGYFHADPHLGNIRVRNGKIVWLDLGMIGRMSTHDRNALRKAMLALADHDAYEMKSAVLALGLPKGRVDHTRLYEDIDVLINKYGDLDFKSLQMGELTHQIMNVLRTHQIGIGPGLSMFARGVLTIEGVMRRCCPDVSFVEIFAVSLQMNFRKNFNWRAELDKFKRDGYVILKKTMQLPEQISDILKMTMSGQTKVNLDITGSEEPIRRIDTMVNKLILGLISSALLLASSVICTTQMTPRIMEMPLVGILGYLAALVLCGRLLVDIIRGK
ncbi:MAG: ABC1 kinase family protein [Selenomonadaceae bacterium]